MPKMLVDICMIEPLVEDVAEAVPVAFEVLVACVAVAETAEALVADEVE